MALTIPSIPLTLPPLSWSRVGVLSCILAVTLLVAASPASAATGQTPGSYVDYTWGTSKLKSVEFRTQVQVYPGPSANAFWSNQFQLDDNKGGYIGLQVRRDATGLFLASFWDAKGCQPGDAGTKCVAFSGEGVGYSVRYEKVWNESDIITFNVKSIGKKQFEASVRNITAGWSVKLGTVTTGADSILATGMSGWLEYFDWNNPATTCQSQPYSSALMFFPTGVGTDDKSYVATVSGTHASTTCVPYTKTDKLSTSTRHENGVGNTIMGNLFSNADLTKCVVFSGANAVDGAAMVVSTCRSGQNQAWVLAADGTLRSPSMLCLGVNAPGGVAGNGALVQLQKCTGGNNQKWSYDTATQALKNALTNRCLDPTPLAATGDSRLQVRDCTRAAAQGWLIPRRK